MSLSETRSGAIRAGFFDCVCALPQVRHGAGRADTLQLSASFACAIVAQALLLTSLPTIGRVIAPSPALANLPYALTWVGAALASFPASILIDQFGRRAAFTLGASTGLAGGLIAAWAAAKGHFPGLCIGAVWLGIAQGFALFYRHAGVAQEGRAQTILRVMAGGCLAAFVVPALAAVAIRAYAPFTESALLAFAGLASVAALPLILRLPHASVDPEPGPIGAASPRHFRLAMLLSASAWAAMTYVMAGAPHALAECGIGTALMSGVVSWHFLAMYGPFALGRGLLSRVGWRGMAAGALVLLLFPFAYSPTSGLLAEMRLLCVAIGWSLAQIASASLLEGANPDRLHLALFDSAVLGTAVAGIMLV